VNFDAAFTELIKHEGGFVDHPSDPGGATRWGVTQAVARENGYTGHMRDFPIELAKDIYRRQYWDAVKAEQLPPAVRYAVFDAAVNSGPRQAIRWLQRAVNAQEDGILGPQTLGLVRDSNSEKLLRVFMAQRLLFMASLSNWPAFGRGWARRVASILEV
jgi:lysozyme family protein